MVSTHEEGTVSLRKRQPNTRGDADGGHWRGFLARLKRERNYMVLGFQSLGGRK